MHFSETNPNRNNCRCLNNINLQKNLKCFLCLINHNISIFFMLEMITHFKNITSFTFYWFKNIDFDGVKARFWLVTRNKKTY